MLGDLAEVQSIPGVKVQNAEQAIEIALQIFRKDKSTEYVDNQQPFSATYKDGNWLVSGYCFDHDRQLQILISAEHTGRCYQSNIVPGFISDGVRHTTPSFLSAF